MKGALEAQPSQGAAPLWSSAAAFYLATVGAAVGLGSIWRLPYLVGSHGGSAFVFLFTVACVLIATPLLVAEFMLGRHSRLSPPEAAGAVAVASGSSTRWNVIGVLGTVAGFLMMIPYTVVAGWVLAYTWKCGTGALVGLPREAVAALWRAFLSSPLEMGAWHLAFLALVGAISARGVSRGIEVVTKVRAPVLLVLLIVLATYALATGDARAGLRFAFVPDFRAISPSVALAAIGQAFYATGVGSAMMLAYGSYVGTGTSLVRSALIITGSILLVSLLATLTIFPLVFGYGMNPAQGPELVFDVLATVFAEMPGGRVMGTLFFLLLVFAALTPTIAGFEPVIAWVEQRWRYSRASAVTMTLAAAWLPAVGAVLSFNHWSGWRPLTWLPMFADQSLFDVLDSVPSDTLLPVGALATSVLVGWRLSRTIVNQELSETTPFARRLCVWALRYACPLGIAAVLAAALG
jgi:NSS family neurotransmitter:Na+ symporter